MSFDIGLIKGITAFLTACLELIKKIFPFKKKEDIYFPIPKKTIIVSPRSNPHGSWWHMGHQPGEPGMQVVGHFKVTNITKYNILLSTVEMKTPKHLAIEVLVKDSESDYHGSYQIPPGGLTDLSFMFWIKPPFKKQSEEFITDIAIVDQFGNKHWIKKVKFISV